MTAIEPTTKFFLAINGQPQRPYTPPMVLNFLHQRTIDGSTLICAEGGAAWVPLQEMEPALRAVAPPAAPIGYSGNAQARGAVPRATQQLIIIKNSDNTRGLRLGTLIAALVLFFLPWLELRCAGQRMVYQSGIQTVLNQGNMDSDMKDMAKMSEGGSGANMESLEGEEFGEKVGYSLLAGGALLCLVLAIVSALGFSGRTASGALAALALGCLGVQALLGFPLETAIEKDFKKEMLRSIDNGGAGGGDSGGAAMKQAMGRTMMKEMIAVKYSPWFYGELALLGVAAVMALAGSPRRQ